MLWLRLLPAWQPATDGCRLPAPPRAQPQPGSQAQEGPTLGAEGWPSYCDCAGARAGLELLSLGLGNGTSLSF